MVSIVMPAYNCEKYIRQAVSTVLAQTLEDWELIVVEDCSTDGTRQILQELARADPRIRPVYHEANKGAAAARNTGFGCCRGEYVALLDSDDLWMPEKLERQLALARATGADIVYCSYEMIDEDGRKKCPDFIVPERTDFDTMLVRSTVSSSTAFLSRRAVERFQFPVNMYHEDLAYWLLLLKNGMTAAGLTEVLASYRVAPGSRASNKLSCALNRWRIYRVFLGLPLLRSLGLILGYALLGLRKYRGIGGTP